MRNKLADLLTAVGITLIVSVVAFSITCAAIGHHYHDNNWTYGKVLTGYYTNPEMNSGMPCDLID